jgi:Skp family chaperone for outer membrane proteins
MIRSVLTFALLIISITVLSAQGNGYLRRDTLLTELPGYTQAIKEFDDMKKMYNEEIKTDRERLNQKVMDLLKPYNTKEGETPESIIGRLSPADASRFSVMEKEAGLIDEKTKSYNDIIDKHYKEKVQPLLDKLNAEVEKYAVKNKLDMVFVLEEIAPALAYINKGRDITPAIIGLLKK